MNDIQREVLRIQIDLEEYHLKMLKEIQAQAAPNKQRKGWITANSIIDTWVEESESRLAALREGL